jgi:hypothetical protein
MRKFTLVLAAALAVSSLFCVAGAGAAAKPASTKLSIRSYPGGVFGYVTSPKTKACSSDRKVVVFEQIGQQPDAKQDHRVAADLAEASESSFLWTVNTGASGEFYARAGVTAGCAAGVSGTVESTTPVLATTGTESQYPTCGPYVSEGTSEICWFGQLYMALEQEGPFNPCRFGSSSGNCAGEGRDAPFPWGTEYVGNHTRGQIYWKQDGSVRALTMVSYWGSSPGGDGAAHLGGHVPSSNSDRYTVTDAYAQNENGYPSGDHFFTPDLPGQTPGEVGGPLKLNFENGSGTDFGAQVWVQGYLYLKH